MRVAVVGASSDRSKYGNRAVRAFRAAGWEVVPVHPTAATIEGLAAYRSLTDVPGDVDLVTVYLKPEITLGVLEEIARKGPGRLFLNPGTESDAVLVRARQLGLSPILACSILAIGRDPENPEAAL